MKKIEITLSEILPLVESYVEALFRKEDTKHLYFHDVEHTRIVAETCKQIGEVLILEKGQAALLEIAAWFHDVGYIYTYEQHEKEGIQVMKDFMKGYEIDTNSIEEVVLLIAGTEVGVKPKTTVLLKEADLSYGVTQDFGQRGHDLRKEWEVNLNKVYTNKEWAKLQEDFIHAVRFESDYGRHYFQPLVNQNIQKMYK